MPFRSLSSSLSFMGWYLRQISAAARKETTDSDGFTCVLFLGTKASRSKSRMHRTRHSLRATSFVGTRIAGCNF